MRKSLWIILTVLVVSIAAPIAHADSFKTFDASGSAFGGEFPLSGTMTIDTTTGVVTVANLSVSFPAGGAGNLTTIQSQQISGADYEVVVAGAPVDGFGFFLDLFFPTTTLKGYQGGSFDPCCTILGLDGEEFLYTGGLVPTAAPEPSSVALMLLGVGLVFVMRKRAHQLT